jgi:activator of HSP90 ATPase
VNAVFALAQSRLPVAIETKLSTFPSAIIDSHGKDLTISGDPSRTGTPAPNNTPPSGPGASTSHTSAPMKPKPKAAKVNSATVVVEADFHASADDLFGLLTNEKRIPIWTRAPAQVYPLLLLHIQD